MNYRIIPVTAFAQNCSLSGAGKPGWRRWSILAAMLNVSKRWWRRLASR